MKNNEYEIDIFTIGFTKKPASKFFSLINNENVNTLIDVRLNTTSQLSGFAKQKDLKYFLKELCNVDYQHIEELAPTKTILDTFKKHKGSWEVYEKEFMELMSKRNVEKILTKDMVKDTCFLCSEDKPHNCHRRLVAEYLNDMWDIDVKIKHLF